MMRTFKIPNKVLFLSLFFQIDFLSINMTQAQTVGNLPIKWPQQVPKSIWFDFTKAKPSDYYSLFKRVEKYRNIKNPYIEYIFGFLVCRLTPNTAYNGIHYLKNAQNYSEASTDLIRKANSLILTCGKAIDESRKYNSTAFEYENKGLTYATVRGPIKGGGFRVLAEETNLINFGKWSTSKLSTDSIKSVYFNQSFLDNYHRTEKENFIFFQYKNFREKAKGDTFLISIQQPNGGRWSETNPNGRGTPSSNIDVIIEDDTTKQINLSDSIEIISPTSNKQGTISYNVGDLEGRPSQEPREYVGENMVAQVDLGYNQTRLEFILENHLLFLEDLFDVSYKGEKIPVFIESSQSMLKQNALLRDSIKLPSSIAGYTNYLFNSINVDITSGSGTFSHELTHIFLNMAYSDAPPWLQEGLPCLYEEFRFAKNIDSQILASIGEYNWRKQFLPEEYKFTKKMFEKYKPKLLSHVLEASNLEFNCIDTFSVEKQAENYAMAREICHYLQDKGLLKEIIKECKLTSLDVKAKSKQYYTELLLKKLGFKHIDELEFDIFIHVNKLKGKDPVIVD